MENQSSRYSDNNYRMQKLQREIQRRKRQKKLMILSLLCTCLLLLIGCLIYFIVFSGEREDRQNKSEYITETTEEENGKKRSSASGTAEIDAEALKEILSTAEKKAEAAGESEDLDKLNQRIEEARAIVDGKEAESNASVAYLNLILAMQELDK